MRRWRWLGGLTAAFAAAAVVTLTAPVPGVPSMAGGQPGGEIGAGQVLAWSFEESPPAGVRQLSSLAGAGFWVPVIGSVFGTSFTDEDGTFTAGPGDELVFVSAELDTFDPPLGQVSSAYTPVRLSVSFAGHSVALPETPSGSVSGVAGSSSGETGTQYSSAWLVAVPDGAAVTLNASEAGFSQAVDLRSGDRVGTAPVVLYRDPAGPLGLDAQSNLAATMAVTAGSDRVRFPVTVTEDLLSYFRLDTETAPSGLGPGDAYLLVSVNVANGIGGQGQYYFDPINPTSAATLNVPGRAPLQAAFGPAYQGSDYNVQGIYGFVVPATLRSATFTLGTGSGQSVYFNNPNTIAGQAEPVTATTGASFPLAFTAAVAVPAAVGAATAGPALTPHAPATTATTTLSRPPTSSRQPAGRVASPGGESSQHRVAGGSSIGLLAGTAGGAGGATLIVVGFVVWRRRTKLVEPIPVNPAAGGLASSAALDVALVGADTAASTTPAESSAEPYAVDRASPVPAEHGQVPTLVVRVLGPLEVEGTTGAIRRRTVQRALIVLAVNCGRLITSDQLRSRLAPDDNSEPTAATVRSEVSRLRTVLPAGVLPDQVSNAGYSLRGAVQVDWVTFAALSAQARSAAQGAERVELARRALALVRGPVLQGDTWHGIDPTVWEIEAAIETLAVDAATAALDAGLPAVAREATTQALLAVPGSPELWRLRLRAAGSSSGENTAVVADRARRQLGYDLTSQS